MTLTTCKTCGFEFEPKSVELFGRFITQYNCEACCQVYEEKLEQERANSAESTAARNAARWLTICDPLYSDTEVEKYPERSRRPRYDALKWTFGPKGLVLHAPSGSGKTRVAFEILKREYDAGRSCAAYNPLQFRNQYSQAAQDNGAQEWIERIIAKDMVLFDDLGQMRLTESSEEALWGVIEGRVADKKPSLFTTQYRGSELVDQFLRPNRGVSIERRLKEFNTVISF